MKLVLLCWIICIKTISATWYFKEAKVCNPKQEGFLPFTGFKIYRQYRLLGYKPQSMCSLTISHCDHGKLDYEKEIVTNNSVDIDWGRPFCVLKPLLGSKEEPKKTDSVYLLVQNKVILNSTGIDKNQNGDQEPLSHDKSGLWNSLKDLIDEKLEKVIKGSHVKYTSKKTKEHIKDIKKSDPQSSLEWESRNLVCYKMARRKKYAKRNILFYMPQTFVGGLFECPIPREKKKQIFQSFTTKDFIKSFEFECDSSIAIPILPLIAEDTTKHWIETHISLFNPTLIQKIPYLTTASKLNLRFASSDTPDMYSDKWASHIEVNEDYTYSAVDLNLISQAIALSTDYMHKNFNPMDISKYFNSVTMFKDYSKAKGHFVLKFVQKMLRGVSGSQKTDVILSFNNSTESMQHLSKLQKIWDNLVH